MPRSKPASWSLNLTLVAAFWFLAFFALVMTGQRGGDTFFSNPWLSGTIMTGAACSVGAAFTGLFAIVRERERSVSVWVTTTLGVLVMLFAILEVAFPH